MKLRRINPVDAMWWGLAVGVVVWTLTASAEEPQRRPGVIRVYNDKCYQITGDTYTDFLNPGPEIPCDDRYKDGEKIANFEMTLKFILQRDNSPSAKASWEAWQASAASAATTYETRVAAYGAEERKQAEEHADESKPFLHGTCEPQDKDEKNNKELLEHNCKFDETRFMRNYWFALQGEHEAQLAVATCFDYSCHRVVDENETMMCAWYLVAASSGHRDSKNAMVSYQLSKCDDKKQAILGTASELFLRIYHRPLPAEAVDEARGYSLISLETFLLDARRLITRKVSLGGVYLREGNLDVLYADEQAAMRSRRETVQPKVLLLTEHASRDFRKILLTCQSDPTSAHGGCSVTVLGRVTVCTLSVFGASRDQACIDVEDGRIRQ